MNTIIQICDVVGAISIIIALNMVARNYKWWLFYACTNVVFSVVTIHKGLPGFTVMGFILSLTGVKNYFDGRWKVNINRLVYQYLKRIFG